MLNLSKNNSQYAPWFIQLSSKISQKQDQTDVYDVIHGGYQPCLSAAQSKSNMEKFYFLNKLVFIMSEIRDAVFIVKFFIHKTSFFYQLLFRNQRIDSVVLLFVVIFVNTTLSVRELIDLDNSQKNLVIYRLVLILMREEIHFQTV